MTDSSHVIRDPVSSPLTPRPTGVLQLLITIVCLGLVVSFLIPAMSTSGRPVSLRGQCKIMLKQIGLALHNYQEQFGAWPPAYTVDADGKPLHSWRTLILPYIDQAPLYNSLDLSKPWNDPANLKLFEQSHVSLYRCPSATMPKNFTTYLAIVGKDCCFDPTRPRKFSEISDGLPNTLAVIEAAPEQAVYWMSPLDAYEELVLTSKPAAKHAHDGGAHVLVMDGHVRFIGDTLPTGTLRSLITIAGNETIGDW